MFYKMEMKSATPVLIAKATAVIPAGTSSAARAVWVADQGWGIANPMPIPYITCHHGGPKQHERCVITNNREDEARADSGNGEGNNGREKHPSRLSC